VKQKTEDIRFQVITKVPPDYEEGNMADHFVEAKDIRFDTVWRKFYRFPDGFGIHVEVFALGEIVIVDEYGREVCGDGRKPSKWLVEFKEFKNIHEALACSRKVTKKDTVRDV